MALDALGIRFGPVDRLDGSNKLAVALSQMYPVLHSSCLFDAEYTDNISDTMVDTFSHTVWPSTPAVPEHIRALLLLFFEVGDSTSPEASRRLGQEVFAQNGQFVMNKEVVSGAEGRSRAHIDRIPIEWRWLTFWLLYAEIAASHYGMLSALLSRRHIITKVYTCSEAVDDLVLIGVVRWTLKSGAELEGPFAARVVVDQSDGVPKLRLYQGWAVSLGLPVQIVSS
jgi:hypothetical protein